MEIHLSKPVFLLAAAMGIVVGEMRFVIAIGLHPQRLNGHAKDLDAAIIDKLIAQHLQNMYLFIISGIF